jgi:hypothetical protein
MCVDTRLERTRVVRLAFWLRSPGRSGALRLLEPADKRTAKLRSLGNYLPVESVVTAAGYVRGVMLVLQRAGQIPEVRWLSSSDGRRFRWICTIRCEMALT